MDVFYNLHEKSDIALIFFITPVISTFFGAASLLLMHIKSHAKRSLAWLLAVVGVFMIAFFISDYYYYSPPYNIFRFWDIWSGLVIAPFVYLYFLSLLKPAENHLKSLLKWLMPALVTAVLYILLSFISKEYSGIYTWEQFREILYYPFPLLRFSTLIIFVLTVLYFGYRIMRMTKYYQESLLDNYSYTEKINVNWVYIIIILLLILGIVSVIGIITSGFIYKLIFSLVTFIIMFAIYILGSLQQDLPENKRETETDLPREVSGERCTFVKNDMGNAKVSSFTRPLIQKIEYLFEEKQIFLNPDLCIQEIAEILYTNRTYISKAINEGRGVNFYQYVNNYRIEHALKLIKIADNNKSLNEIAYESGFKTRSTFYSLFKVKTGCTPKEYMMKLREKQL